jgi:putative ABC transport system permease protein
MNLVDTWQSSLEALVSRRMQALLTVTGILIGIAAVILTVGLGLGAQQQVAAAISSLGENLLIVTPGSTTSTSGIRAGIGSASTLTLSDAEALAAHRDTPSIVRVAPEVTRPEVLVSGSSNWTAPIVGTTPAYLPTTNRTLAVGQFLTRQEVADGANDVVLGSTVAENLFGFRSPVGQTVTINGLPFQVVGELQSAGGSSSSTSAASASQDDMALVPITTAQADFTGSDSVSEILLQARSQQLLGAAYDEANTLLLNLHHITSPASADFTITAETSLETAATSATRTLTVLLGGIAAISLLVGGIGVMNIMLVSVTERIREIGLRKALGATPTSIRRQFLTEAVILGLAGGTLGVVVGLVGAAILPRLISDPITISWPAVVGALVVAMGVGLVFGVYPASRAARLSPIDAIRAD